MRSRAPVSAKIPVRKAEQSASLREAREVPPSETWQAFFRRRIESAPFVPYDLDFDLDNPEIAAHLSRSAYLDLYGRDADVELWARLSMCLQPSMIVELGTAFGIRTNLLGKLNPGANLISVDNVSPLPLNDDRVETGYIARLNRVPFTFVHGETHKTQIPRQFNLCYVDACHSAECVGKDTAWAWANRNPGRFAIVWDDYDRESVQAAVRALCERYGLLLHEAGRMAWVGEGGWMKGMA